MAASPQVQRPPRLMRRRSEAEILSYEAAAKTSNHILHLNLSEKENSSETLGEKFQRSLSVSSNDGGPTSPTSSKATQTRRVSLSALEETHFCRAMMSGAFESQSERARKARKKSFEKVRKRSGDEERKRKDRKTSFEPIPDG